MGRMPERPGIQASWAYNDETTLTSLSVRVIHLSAVPFPSPIPRELRHVLKTNTAGQRSCTVKNEFDIFVSELQFFILMKERN